MLDDTHGVDFLCRGTTAVITLQLLTGRTSDGNPIWKKIATQSIDIPKGDGLLEGGACKLKGADVDAEIIPIGHYSKKGAAIVTHAYRGSVAHGAIETIKERVECEVEGD